MPVAGRCATSSVIMAAAVVGVDVGVIIVALAVAKNGEELIFSTGADDLLEVVKFSQNLPKTDVPGSFCAR